METVQGAVGLLLVKLFRFPSRSDTCVSPMASSTCVFLGSLSSLVDFFRRPLYPAPPVTALRLIHRDRSRGCWSMLRFRSIGRAHVTSGQPLLGYWKQSRTVNSCTLPVWILIITVSHTVGSLWSSRLRRSQQEGTVFQLRVLRHSISCLRAHHTRHTSRLGSSQHRLHRHQWSFACFKLST